MDGVIDRADFERWLKEQEPDAWVGTTCEMWSCPLATYLSNAKGRAVAVYGGYFSDQDTGDYCGMPDWAEEFVELVDSLPDREVTAEQAISVLAEVTE